MTKTDQVVFKDLLTKQFQGQSSVQIDMISIDKVFWASSISEMRQQLEAFCHDNGLTVVYEPDGRFVTLTQIKA